MKNILKRTLSVLIVLTFVFTTFMVFDPADVFNLGMKAQGVSWLNTWEGSGSLFYNKNAGIWGTYYRDFAQFAVSRTFYNGEFYELEYDAKGSGTIINYFYGESGYKNCSHADVTSSDGRYNTYKTVGGDGDTRFDMTSDWVHYRVIWRLDDSGSSSVTKYVLWRSYGTSADIYVTNIRFRKLGSHYESQFGTGSSGYEYYNNTAKTNYYKWFGIYYSSSGNSDATNNVQSGGYYTEFTGNLNGGSGNSGKYVHGGYKKLDSGDNLMLAVRAIRFSRESSDHYKTSSINGSTVTWYRVGECYDECVTDGSDNSPNNTLHTFTDPTRWLDKVCDTNVGGGGKTIHMYCTRDPAAGPPITDVIVTHDGSVTSGYTCCTTHTRTTTNQDLSEGAHGDTVYMMYKSSATRVDTSSLRSNMNTAASLMARSYYNTNNKYTSASKTTLQNAYNAARPVIADYDLDAFSSTYSQTNINSYNTTLSNALSNMQTVITISGNGGSASASSATITCGTAESVTFPGGSYTASRTGYTFKGWSTSSSASSGTTGNLTGVSLAGTVYATWQINSYKLTINPNGGTWNGTTGATTITQNYNTTYTVSGTPTRTGYTFGSWSKGGTGTWSSPTWTFGAGDGTLTASWTINQYYIDLNGRLDGKDSGNISGYGTADAYVGGSRQADDCTDFWSQWNYGSSYEFKDIKASRGHRYVGVYSGSLTGTLGASTASTYLEFATNAYTIAYNGNGGGGTAPTSHSNIYYNDPQSCSFKLSEKTRANTFTYAGYDFVKWNSKADGSGTAYTANSDSVSAKTLVDLCSTDPGNGGTVYLYAQWTPHTYNIDYDLAGGSLASGVTNPSTYNITTATFTLNNPSRTGYTFNGWTGSNGSTPQTTVTITKGTYGDKNYTAKWTANQYEVSFDVNHDSIGVNLFNPLTTSASNGGITYAYDATDETVTFNCSNITSSVGAFAFSPSKPFEAGTYKVTVTKISGSSTFTSSCLCLKLFAADHSSFVHDRNVNYIEYTGGASNTYTWTLTAAQAANVGSMSWHLYVGSGGKTTMTNLKVKIKIEKVASSSSATTEYSPVSRTVTYDGTYGTMPTVTRAGYTLSGWTSDGTASGTSYTSDTTVKITSDVTLKAYWTTTEYKITYAGLSGISGWTDATGTTNPNPSKYYVTSTTFTLKNPTKTGYNFTGWTGTGLDGATTTVTITKGSTGDRSYTATWSAISYTISYTLNSGTVATANPTSYTIETNTITLNNPTRSGYTFTGWTGSNGSTAQTTVTIPKGSTGNKTYTANWSAIKYTVTLDQQSGSGGSTSVQATYDSAMPSATMPTRSGYDFGGYYTEENGGGTQYYTNQGASARSWDIAEDTTLYAKWTVHEYTISYTMNGGTNSSSNPSKYYITSNAITLADATKTGYTFTGWTGNGTTDPTKNLVLAAGSTGNKTFTANWTATEYSITYTLNNGTLASGVTNPVKYTVLTAAFTLNNPSKTGYTFNGWTGSNGSTPQLTVKVTPGTGTTNGLTNVRSPLSFTANFTVDSYTLTFIPDGGTFKAVGGFTANSSNQQKSITYGSTYGASDGSKTWPEIERTGYTFDGWYNGTTKYESTTTVSVTASHDVTAQWTLEEYTIDINYAGGSVATANPTKYYYTSDAITLNQPTREGYTFAGYTGTGLSQATKSVTIPAGSTGDRSYTATWTTVTYTITYVMNDGTNAASNPSSYTIESDAITLADATKTGWTFNGWTGNGTTTATKNLVLPAGSTGNKTFTANFTANKYTVTLNKQSGSGGTNSVQATYGSEMPSATMPTRTGYTFGGYYTEVNGGGTQYYTGAGASARSWNIADNRTLYAKWTINTSTLTVKPAGGTYSGSTNDTSYSNKQYGSTQSIEDPSRDGYTFDGWTLNDGANGSFNANQKLYTFGPANGVTDTLTAQWTAVKYTITYDYAGGGVSTANPTEYYVTTADFTLNQPTRTGYTFAGYTGTGLSQATKVVTVAQGSTGNRSYTATWTANTTTLTFNANSGTFKAAGGFTAGTANQSKTVTYDSTYGAAAGGKTWPTVERTGYDFSEWNTASDGSGTTYASTDTVTITGVQTIYAVWTATEYNLVCNLNGGEYTNGESNPAKYTIESADITLKKPSKAGYTFTGWTGDNGNNPQLTVTITQGSTGDKTYNANYETVSYTISYNLNNGALQGNQTNPTSYTVETATFTLNNPARAGYTFLGWTGSNGDVAQTTVQIVKGSTGNKTYTANWDAKEYTVTFNMQEGAGGTESTKVTYDAAMPAITLPARSGYTFAGYYTAANGGGTDYYDGDGASVRNWNIAEDTTLFANWTPTGYTITFNTDDGAAVYTNNSLSYNIASTSRLVSTTKNGYSFNGWKPTADAGNWRTGSTYAGGNGTTSGFLLTGMYGNVTLKAQWAVVKYTITYDANATGVSAPTAQDYYITTNLTLKAGPERTGYEFDGWLPDSTTTSGTNWSTTQGNYVGNVGTGMYGNVTLKAQWIANEYTITFNPNGGTVTAGGGFPAFSGTTTESKTVTYGKTYGTTNDGKSWPNNPTKEGYDFGGWKNGNTAFTSGGTVTITEDTDLTAEWNIQSYNVTVLTANSGTASSGYATAGVSSGLTNGKANYHATVTLQYTAGVGYEFVNWTSSDVTVNAQNQFTMPAKAVTVTANFKPTTYTIGYNLDNGALPSGKTNPETYTIETANITLNNPERTGYDFAGWRVTNSSDTPTTTLVIYKGTTGNLNYTAVWSAKQYSVTLDRQGGNTGSTGVQPYYGSAMPSATMPTRNGYEFAGYFAQTGGQGTQYYNADGTSAHNWDVASNSTIYAHWTVKTYDITYNYLYNSTFETANPDTYQITDDDITLNNPSRTGYNFTGWTGTGLDNVTLSVTIPSGSYGDRTYNANWSLINYTISYELGGGELGSGKTNPETYTIETAEITLNNPTKPGYNFTGWKGGVVGQTPVTQAIVKIAQGSTGNRSYEAQYTARSYTLTFYLDSESAEPYSVMSYKPTDTYTLDVDDTAKPGYSFDGWKVIDITNSTASNPNYWTVGSMYNATDTVSGKYGNATLEGQWSKKSYKLTVDPTGGMFNNTTDPSNFTQEYDTTKTLGTASRNGYDFMGWTKVSGEGTYTANSNPKTGGTFRYGAGNAAVEAQWQAITYTITCDYGVGDGSVTNPTSYTIETPTFTLNNPSKDGYTFQGWTGTNLGSTTQTVTITKGSTGNRTFTAQWTKNVYTVTLDRQGGTTGSIEVAATYNEAMPSAAMPTKDGHTFQGYYAQTEGRGTKYYNANGSSANVWDRAEDATIYAYWTADTYTLVFVPNGGFFDVDENDNDGGFATGESAKENQSKQVTFGQSYGKADVNGRTWPAQMTYVGHTFAGWKDANNNTITKTATVSTTASTILLTAQWTAKTFTVAFDANGVNATITPVSKTLEYGTSSTYAPTPTKADSTDAWVFRGWSTNRNTTSGDVAGGGTQISAQTVNGWFNDVGEGNTKTVYAIWQKTLSATFRDGQGDDMVSTKLIYNGAENGEVAVKTQRDYAGWTKKGWTTSTSNTATGDTTSTKYTIAENVITTTNTTVMYYGLYERTVAVSYDANGGSAVSPTPVTQKVNGNNVSDWTNKTVELAAASTRAGYTFAGWEIGGTVYDAGDDYTITGNVTATAQWTLSDFTVTIDPNEGTVSSITYYTGGTTDEDIAEETDVTETVALETVHGTLMTLALPERNGYAFTGWEVTATDGGSLPADGVITNSTEAESTYLVGAGDVTLTATWAARTYAIRYTAGDVETWEVLGGTYDYDGEVEIADADVLGKTYPGYMFQEWSIVFDENGETVAAGETFTLSDWEVSFDELDVVNGVPTVYLAANWAPAFFQIRYDTNGYDLSDIKTAGKKTTWGWSEYATGDLLSKGEDGGTAQISGAYSDSVFGTGSYYYLNTATEVRFGLGWSFDSTATEPDVPFHTNLTIADVSDEILANAEQIDENLYELTLYMIWSANYKPLEDAIAQFQRTYETFPETGLVTLRGYKYKGAQADKAVYLNEPDSARLPTVSSADNAYKAGGSEALEIWDNDTTAADYATYAWVAGQVGNLNSWATHYNEDANDFTPSSVRDVNTRIRQVMNLVITDPTAQYGSLISQAAEEENGTLETAAANMTDAVTSPQTSYLLQGLALKDVNLDKRLTLSEMQEFDGAITYSSGCATEEGDGLSYRPDEETVSFMGEVFGEELNEMYPDCENEEVPGENDEVIVLYHSFNSLIDMANEIFATFGFNANEERDYDADYFMDGTLMGFDVDPATNFVINPDCPYTTESVYLLFDLIYGNNSHVTYAEGATVNRGETALYYKVKDAIGPNANVILKRPSQHKLSEIVTEMSYGYHSLEMAKADYEEFRTLFQRYFDATWGVELAKAGYALGSSSLSTYSGYFTDESYEMLSRFMTLFFSGSATLKQDLDKRPGVEQAMINGKPEDTGWVRWYKNEYIDASEVDLSAFNYAERDHQTAFADRWSYDEETETWDLDMSGTTLCSLFCDAIDALVPATADYTAVFALIANNACRTKDRETYMIDTRSCAPDEVNAYVNAFYPSTADKIHQVIGENTTNYDVWRAEYAKANAWGSTRANGKPAYDTEWLYRYYTKASVDRLARELRQIVWNYNKLNQSAIDGMANNVYKEGTICYNLKNAIDNLEPKTYAIEFYKGLYEETDPDYYDKDFVNSTDFYFSGNIRKDYHYGDTVHYTQVADPYNMKTFNGWNTKRNNLGRNVSVVSDLFTVDFALDDTLLGTPDAPNTTTAVITTEDSKLYTVKLYAEWVDNVTLYIDMAGGSATVTPDIANAESFTVEGNTNNTPSYNYRTKLTFSNMTKTGYQFDHWTFQTGSHNTNCAFNNETNEYTYGYCSGSPTYDTLTANWAKNTYTVTFHENYTGSTRTATQTFRYDTPQNLTTFAQTAFARSGWRFTNWTDANDVPYTDGQEVNNLTAEQNGNFDLYAQWEVADFTLTFRNEFTLPDWYDEDLGTYTWAAWAGEEATDADLTKIVTANELYNKTDENGKGWPTDPVITYEITDNVTVKVTFLGWYTQKDEGGTKINPTGTVTTLEDQTVYPHFNFERTETEKAALEVPLVFMNANLYTMESMRYVDEWLQMILAEDYEVTEDDLEELQRRMDALELVTDEDGDAAGDTTAPVVNVYENKAALQAAITSGEFRGSQDDVDYMLSEETGEVSYVFPGKAYYTYYCYTNSTQPAIMLNAKELLGDSRRVSYPVTFSMRSGEDDLNGSSQLRTRTGTVGSGWMNYSQDPEGYTDRTAGYHIGRNSLQNPYKNDLTYFGMNYDGTGYNHYMYEEYILLKPTFVSDGTKQYALYTFEVTDDSVGDLAASEAALAGAANTSSATADLTKTSNEDITPTGTITIFVEYYNTMNGCDGDAGGQVVNKATGVGTYNGNALEVYNEFHENGYQNNVWVNQDHLYRNSGGASNADFVTPVAAEDGTYVSYLANDPIYGQTDVGSFYYLMKSDDPATTLYWNTYDAYLEDNPNDNDAYHNARVAAAHAALGEAKKTVVKDMQDPAKRAKLDSTETQAAHVTNGDYIYWPYTTNTKWSTQYYAPARTREDTLVYVHIYDRWGNHYTNILQRDLQDTQAATATVLTRGAVTINELGGSGVSDVTFYQLNTQKKVNVGGQTDGQTWNVENNQFTVTGLPEGANDYRYTMKITDNAGSEQTVNIQADTNGCLVVTVNDENMGGAYANAANTPAVTGSAVDPELNGATLSVEEVTAEEIRIDTIPEEQQNGGAAPEAEKPDVYTFTVNGVYTVNLFADTTRDYAVTLKSTMGGTLKAYVNGEFAAPQNGKIAVPAGARVQIRLAANTGYELQSLTMLYPDGKSVDLVGAYDTLINDDVTIKAVFAKTDALLTIRVENGAVSGKQQMLVSPRSRVAAVADPAPAGKVFAYWTQNGSEVPVSYDNIYTFIATSDVDLKANYADEAAEPTANIVMDLASPTQVTLVNGRYTLAYSGKITLPEGAQIEEFGMVLTNQSAQSCTAENFVIGGTVNGKNVAKMVGQTVTDGQIMLNVNNVAAGQTRTGRLYMTVKLADGTTQTLYSDTWAELNTPAA